jgi:hypothetical protein
VTSESPVWEAVLDEFELRPWIEIVDHCLIDLADEDAGSDRLRALVKEAETAFLDGSLTRFSLEVSRRGLNDCLRGDAWISLVVKERQTALGLIGRLHGLAADAGFAADFTVESHGPAEHPRYERLRLRLRFARRSELHLWCQLLLAALYEIPV